MFLHFFDLLGYNTYDYAAIDFVRLFPQLAADLYNAKPALSKKRVASISDSIKTALDESSVYFPSILIDAMQIDGQGKNHAISSLYNSLLNGQLDRIDYYNEHSKESSITTIPENDILLAFCKNHGQHIESALDDDLKFLMMSVSLLMRISGEEDKYSWTYGISIDDILERIKIVKNKESFDRILRTIYRDRNTQTLSAKSRIHYLETPFLFALHRSADPSKNPYVPRKNDDSLRNKQIVPKSFFSAFNTVPITEQDVTDNLKNFAPSDNKDQDKVEALITRYSPKALATINQYFIESLTATAYLNLLSDFKDNEIIIEPLTKFLLSPLLQTRMAIVKAVKNEIANAQKNQISNFYDKQVKALANYINYLYDSYTYIALPAAFLSYTFLYQQFKESQAKGNNDSDLQQIIIYFDNEYSEKNAVALKALLNKDYARPHDFYEKSLQYKVSNNNYNTSKKLHEILNEPYFSTHIKNTIACYRERFTINY